MEKYIRFFLETSVNPSKVTARFQTNPGRAQTSSKINGLAQLRDTLRRTVQNLGQTGRQSGLVVWARNRPLPSRRLTTVTS